MWVHLVDGTYELFRAHYSKRPSHTAPAGWDAKATTGVVQSLINMMWDPNEKVTHLAVAFDNPIVSFRNDLFAGYKTDEGMEPALRSQFDAVEEAVAALGITVWSMKEFEADDALASGAWKYGADPRVESVRLMTPDKDMNQCLAWPKVVQHDRMRQRTITAATVLEDRGIEPPSIPDYLALIGDTSDGIPGIDGWGEKSAAAVLREYQTVEAIPDRASEWKVKVRSADRLAAALAANREPALLYKKLATLRTDAPVPQSLDELAYQGPSAQWESWCEKLGVPEMAKKPPKGPRPAPAHPERSP
ncbi:MAG: flap endonuclease [Myxococcaceae bacterium]|nr:flap endonuclease [Myxococcaceae bacterium]